jgi:isopentenyl-diphosphate delta-isomerase
MTESPAILVARAALASVDLSNYDPEQSRLMSERCILVDEQDNAIGAMYKKTCAFSWKYSTCFPLLTFFF